MGPDSFSVLCLPFIHYSSVGSSSPKLFDVFLISIVFVLKSNKSTVYFCFLLKGKRAPVNLEESSIALKGKNYQDFLENPENS